jgi:ATP-dependent 26S proteasome regulatory subunit
MHRRITLAVEFHVPNPRLRCSIWQAHIPDSVTLDKDVNFEELALKFELSGGFIKNTVMAALSAAVARNPNQPVINMGDLTTGTGRRRKTRKKRKKKTAVLYS